MKRTRLLQTRPTPTPAPKPEPTSAVSDRIRVTVTVHDRSFHLLPTPHVVSHLHRDPKILRKWFPMTLGNQRYVVTLAGQGWQHAMSVSH
jgi:hypothetical protein